MNTVEILKAARAKIEKEENWCQGAYARDADDNDVDDKSPRACRWCAWGALNVIENVMFSDVGYNALVEYCSGQGVGGFNDTHTHAEVLALFDKAIAAEKVKFSFPDRATGPVNVNVFA
jgi:hypothetical protein